MPFEFKELPIQGLVVVQPRRFSDDRGWFSETYKYSDFSSAGIAEAFVQDNMSVSEAGTLRGLHYQLPPHAQGKLVQVIRGSIWDVAVDIRRSSDTFGHWYGIELSETNGTLFWIPPAFAHGFVALEDNTCVSYKCTSEYHTDSERSIRYSDSTLSIDWPPVSGVGEYKLSQKDNDAPLLETAQVFS